MVHLCDEMDLPSKSIILKSFINCPKRVNVRKQQQQKNNKRNRMVANVDSTIHANKHTHTQTDIEEIVEVMHNTHCNRDVSAKLLVRFTMYL